MAMDIRIPGLGRIASGTLLRRQMLGAFQILIVLSETIGSPVWMPQFLSGGQGRSIRHLPCISRRTGEQGVCMFAYTCLKSNGTHLGTCIDRFYFGSCCKLDDTSDLMLEGQFPLINNNQVSSPYNPTGGNSNNVQTGSVQSVSNKVTGSHVSANFPPETTVKVETTTRKLGTTVGNKYGTTDKTVVDLTQHPSTETVFTTSSTDRFFYVPVHTSKPNRTGVVSSGPHPPTTPVSSSSAYSGVKRPTIANQNNYNATEPTTSTTQSYLLSTFQVVHNQGTGLSSNSTPSSTTSKHPLKPAISGSSAKPVTTTPSSLTTTKKPVKPAKPYTTTRKPTTKKPTTKPAVKPISSTPVRSTTAKPTTPVKKPTQPTKKPSTTKPSTGKPSTVTRPAIRPSNATTTATRPASTTPRPTTPARKPSTTPPSKYPMFTTFAETTSEVVFTKPGSTPVHGITTFRPDLGTTSFKPPANTGSGLTTFSYVSEGVKHTTVKPTATTTSRPRPDTIKPAINNEMFSHWATSGTTEPPGPNIDQVHHQAVITMRPPIPTTKPVDPTDGGKPEMPTQWIEMVQTTPRPTPPYFPTAATLSPSVMASAALLEGLNQTDYTEVCGRRIYPQARVVGGEKSTFGKWPWQISLRQWRTSTYLHKCGAALLNENWAITAAHCVESVPPSDLLLRLGEHDLSTEDEPFGFQERRVQIVASHPQFDPRTFEYDLALLRFYEPVKFQPNIIPVCVPEDNTNFVGQTAYVTGWGRLYEDGPLPSVLQEVSVPVINNTLCENMYRSAGYIEHIPEIFICAGWKKGGFDSCEGDSGGPMVIQRADKRWLLAGVISWGIGCAEPNQPGVYTRISEFREWIHQILQF